MTGRGGARAAGLITLGLLLMAGTPFPYSDLPANLPERRPGLWEIHTEGRLTGAVKTYEERSRICMNAAVDRALYRDDLDAKHMTVAMMDGNCAAPVYALDGNHLTMTMHCTSRGVEGSPRAETAFESTTTYSGPERVIVEHRRTDRNHVVFDGVSTYHDTMTRIGDCEPAQKPGDRIRIDSRMNGSEIQKSMRTDNIFDASRTHRKVMEDILAAHGRLNAAGL